jgi:16S rRNA G966 N2-methylase RsmD
VHAYHTKVPPEAIRPYIERHTASGQVCLDPFAGSGMTGVAAALSGRRAVLNDLSPAAVHIARNYTQPCDPDALLSAAGRLLAWADPQIEPLYETRCPSCGGSARTEYVVWSDVRACPKCAAHLTLWDHRDAETLRRLTCPSCAATFDKVKAPLIGEKPVQVNLSCPACGGARFEATPTAEDVARTTVSRAKVPFWYPDLPFGPDWEMWRGGHRDLGIDSVADFWSGRNLFALSVLFEGIRREADERLREALLWAFTAIVNRASRRYQWNAKRPTNVLGGTLYIASLRYEWNVLSLFGRKVRAATNYYRATPLAAGAVTVTEGSATNLAVPSGSIDYVFTDIPFGANIYYADASLLWEAWLGRLTDRSLEAVVSSKRPGKSVGDYQDLMCRAFAEIRRVLKPGALATVVFQNTDPAVWQAIQDAASRAGLHLASATTLHKRQPSFKGIKAMQEGERVASTDVVMSFSTSGRDTIGDTAALDAERVVVEAIEQDLAQGEVGRVREVGHLYAVAMGALVNAGVSTEGWSFDRIAALVAGLAPSTEQLSLGMGDQ